MVIPPLDRRRLRATADEGWELIGARCRSCRHTMHPVRPVCPRCGHGCEIVRLHPAGTVVAATVVRATRPDVLLRPPFGVVAVVLADGPVLTLPVAGSDRPTPGDRVDVEPFEVGDGDARWRALQARVAS